MLLEREMPSMNIVLYVDFSLTGHHIPYLRSILAKSNSKQKSILVLPSLPNEFKDFECFELGSFKHRSFFVYLRWMRNIKQIIKKVKPDIVHFLFGDELYPFFGFGLSYLRKIKSIVTFHRVNESKLGLFSIKQICKRIDCGIVLTDYLFNKLKMRGINNLKLIPYPSCLQYTKVSKDEARKRLNIVTDNKLFLMIGATSYYKGLDLFLESSSSFEHECDALIAGKFTDFDFSFVNGFSEKFNGKLFCLNRVLTDEEFFLCICAADYLVLPYRKTFNGISGPMIEAIQLEIPIIGPDCNSIGFEIKEYGIGLVFKAEDINSLSFVINSTFTTSYNFSQALQLRKSELDPNVLLAKYTELYKEIID